ncbi:MAG: DUF1810 domain-containing protein [bacterium]|nr:DUF1810 domain-containing protein [bacterium]
MSDVDSYNLERFVSAQGGDYEIAVQELRRGRKKSHWIWYIFPQVAGLGSSSTAQRYAIRTRGEAVAYLAHELLGPRLHECAQMLLRLGECDIDRVMGSPDNLKLKSSMTLFAAISPIENVFQAVLDRYFDGQTDPMTLAYLNRETTD